MESSRPSVRSEGNPDALPCAERNEPAAPILPHQASVNWATANRAAAIRDDGGEALREVPAGLALPKLLNGLFWDCQFDDLRLPDDLPFIVGRVLTSGSWSQIGWLRQRVGDDCLRQWICAREGRPLDHRQLRFWELILDLPSRQVDRWLACRSRSVWDRRACRETDLRETGQGEMDP